MSNSADVPETDKTDAAAARRHHPLVLALAVVIGAEALGLVVATVFLVIEVLIAPADNIISAIALAATAAIAAIWVAVIAVHVLRGNAWVRGASIVVQVLIAAVAIGSFQGIGASPEVGIALLVPVVLVLVLLFARPVVLATSHRE